MFKLRKWTKSGLLGLLAVCALVLASLYPMGAVAGAPLLTATAPGLGSAGSFAVLGASTVTNTGSSVVEGDLGVSPGSAVTGFPPGVLVGGNVHAADALAQQAQDAVTTANTQLGGQACDFDLTGQDLGGQTLAPGVYCFSSSAQLTGNVTLDFQNSGNSVFVFKIGTALTTGSSASVGMINGANACHVFWKVGSSATIGGGTNFAGIIIAGASISMNGGATLSGSAFARTGAVTLINNNVSNSRCYKAYTATPTIPSGATATATAPSGATATATAPSGATATATGIPASPTATTSPGAPTATATTAAATSTATVGVPTSTATPGGPTSTATLVAPTSTATIAAPTATRTLIPAPPTATPIPQAPTATPIPQGPTATPVPQAATATPLSQAATATPAAATPAPTATTVVATKLPSTGAPPSADIASLVLAGGGIALIGLSAMMRRRRYPK